MLFEEEYTDAVLVMDEAGTACPVDVQKIVRDTARRPIYARTAAYGHFGRSGLDLPWERLDKIDELKEDFHAFSGN